MFLPQKVALVLCAIGDGDRQRKKEDEDGGRRENKVRGGGGLDLGFWKVKKSKKLH